MLIYLKGINSVQLEYLLDFIYNGEASVGQEELKEFLETGKDLRVKGFEAYVSGMGENEQEDPIALIDEKEDLYENKHNDINEDSVHDILVPSSVNQYLEVAFTETNEGNIQINKNNDLELQIMEIIEKSEGVWKCKVCGKTSNKKSHTRRHAETHIEGLPHVCHICNKSFSTTNSLQSHHKRTHNEILS